jgi:tetratricopeptide (TPR) repeat protein
MNIVMKTSIKIILIIVLLLFSTIAYAQEEAWKDLIVKSDEFNKCVEHIINEDFERAITACKKAIKNSSSNEFTGFIYVYLGYAYRKLNMDKEASEAYSQASWQATLHPEIRNLRDSYAFCGMILDEYFANKQAVRENPNDALAHYNLALAYVMVGKLEKAYEEHKILKGLNSEIANELLKQLQEFENKVNEYKK